jgi:hypothetical protein
MGLRERLDGSAAPGECGRFDMDVQYFTRTSLRKNKISILRNDEISIST